MVYTESDLVIPALSLLLDSKQGLTTSELIGLLSNLLEITGKDAEILSGRRDTHFSQKVRNLVSHRTLVRKKLAAYEEIPNGLHKITEGGKKYLINNIGNFEFIIKNGFGETERKTIIDNDFLELIVEEGQQNIIQVKNRKRSAKLIKLAKEFYVVDNRISCKACTFNFEDFYGDIGKGVIEIHHLKPVYTYNLEGSRSSIATALENVLPVCSNCHTIIHKRQEPLSLVKLKELIANKGIFNYLP